MDRLATRALPAAVALRWKVMPYRVDAGQLHIVTADVPSEAMIRELNRLSELELRFHLVRPNEFENLAREYLPAPAPAGHLAHRNFRLDTPETRPIH